MTEGEAVISTEAKGHEVFTLPPVTEGLQSYSFCVVFSMADMYIEKSFLQIMVHWLKR
jgi:hypothetical protein